MSIRESVPNSGADEATQAMDLAEVADPSGSLPRRKLSTAGEEPAGAPGEEDTETTALLPTEPVAPAPELTEDPVEARERRRAERDQALGTRRPAPDPEPEESSRLKHKRTTDKLLGSLGLFLLRIVAAGIIGLHAFAKAMDIQGVQTMLANTIIPEPVVMSYVLTGAEVAIALALLFGLLTRIAGLGLAAIGIGALVFVHWTGNPFVGNALTGELELLLGAVGLLFVLLGAGGWSIDASYRRRRAAEAA